MHFLELQVDGPDDGFGAALAGLAGELERQPAVALPKLLEVAERAATERAFAASLMGLLLAEKAAYEAELWPEARSVGAKAVELARQTGDVLGEAQAYRTLALVAFDEGRSKDGHDHLLDAMSAFDDAGRPEEVPGLMRIYGEHLALLGALPEAEQALREAEKRFVALGDRQAAASVAADLAQLRQRKQ